jgi:hypothetical protein
MSAADDDRRPKITSAWTAAPSTKVAAHHSSTIATVITSLPPTMPILADDIPLTASPHATAATGPRRNRAEAYRLQERDTKEALPHTITEGNVHSDDHEQHQLPSPPMKAWNIQPTKSAAAVAAFTGYEWPTGTGTRVLIVTGVGSRGDVEPFLALALALQRTGRHRVVMSVPPPFGDWVHSFGIHAIQHDIDLVARLRDAPGMYVCHTSVYVVTIHCSSRSIYVLCYDM